MTSPGEEIAKEFRHKKKHAPANEIKVRELELYLQNDRDIYLQRLVPIYKNLQSKKTKGIYDHTKAIRGMGYAVNDANSKYKKEHGYSFTTSVRYQVAKNMVKYFEDEYRIGNRY
jgi:hypothetical protein